MQLPRFIVAYATALLSAPWRFTLVYLSLFSGTSHDFLTRGLKQKYPWKQILQILLHNQVLSEGYLIIDETDVDKSFGEKIPCLGWLWSHRKNKYIFGLHIVVVCWTNTKITIPLAWKIYKKESGKTKLDLALELIQYCLFTLRIQPKAFLFDSFYASEPLLKYLINHKQLFYSQVPKNRKFNEIFLRDIHKRRPYWQETGVIRGGIKVQVVKNRRKYYVTNHIGISRKEQLQTYKIRWNIEEVFRFVKKELGFERCQVTSLVGQNAHFGTCFYLYALLQDIAAKTQMTDYAVKLKATLDDNFVKQLALPTYLSTA
jgi:hypothetical protein